MQKLSAVAGFLAVASALGIASSGAAQPPNNIAFVDAGSGVDGANCGARGAECKTLSAALAVIAGGGSVVILSGGTFGPIVLNQPVTIVGPADHSAIIGWTGGTTPGCIGGAPAGCAGISIANYAVEITAGLDGAYRLENLVIDNAFGSNGAMKISGVSNVSMTGTVLRGGFGTIPQVLLVAPNTDAQFHLLMWRCEVALSGSGGGIVVQPGGTTNANVQLIDSVVHDTKFGIKFDASQAQPSDVAVQASIDGSRFYSFNGSAIAALTRTSVNATFALIHVSRSDLRNAGAMAIQANGDGARFDLYGNTITGNAIGINVQSGGHIQTLGNNEVLNNGADCASAGTLAACSGVVQPQGLL